MTVKVNHTFLRKLEKDVRDRGFYLKRGAAASLSRAVFVGKETLREGLLAAETRTGLARAELGGHPGRYDSGNLVDGVQSFAQPVLESRDGEGWFGWPTSAAAFSYAREQDEGTDKIPAAGAMPVAHLIAIEELREGLIAFGFQRRSR